MKLTNKGIEFSYENRDTITYLWPWKRPPNRKWYSSRFNCYFQSLATYVASLNDHSARITESVSSLSLEQVLKYYLSHDLVDGNYVLLYDINLESKPSAFWETLGEKAKHFSNDLVILKAESEDQAITLLCSISREFARAIAATNGEIIGTNDLFGSK